MISSKQTIGQIAHSTPATIQLFEALGIQYCCHGQLGIDSAAKAAGISVPDLLAKIYVAAKSSLDSKGIWVDPILRALILHLIRSRKSLVDTELPRISLLARSVAQCGSQVQPNAAELAMVVEALARELESHLAKEKAELFPLIQNIELAYVGEDVSIAHPKAFRRSIGKMVHEHEEVGYLLSAANRLTDGYDGASSACSPYLELCNKLKNLDREIREEVHLENNVLFNRALQFSEALRPSTAIAR